MPNAQGFTVSVLSQLSDDAHFFATKFRFSIDNVSKGLYKVTNKFKNVEIYTWDYELSNALQFMDDYKITYDVLHTAFMNTSDTYKKLNPDNQGYSNISVPWAIECLMTAAGLPVDASELYLENIYTNVLNYSGYTYYLRDFRLCESMIYCLNQDYVMDHVKIDNNVFTQHDNDVSGISLDYDAHQKLISGFKLFQFLSGIFLISTKFENGYYRLERRKFVHQESSEKYTIPQSDTYQYQSKQIQRKDPAYNFGINGSTYRSYYYDGEVHPNAKYSQIKNEGASIDWINHLIILFQDKTQTPGIILNPHETGHYLNGLQVAEISRIMDAEIDNESEENIEAKIQTSFYNVVEHAIEPRRERSIIKQGVFTV